MNIVRITSFFILQFCISLVALFFSVNCTDSQTENPTIVKLTDEKWDQIQRGQWLIGFFDKETKESNQLENDWTVLAMKCKEQSINVGMIYVAENPGLDVRFLVSTFPRVFYVKNGVAHEIPKVNTETIVNVIKDKQWGQLKPVNFLSNPFSVQMSLLSHLFIHAVSLYNFENAIVQEIIPFKSATDIAFGITFIVIGTTLGLILTCFASIIQLFFFDSNESDDEVTEDEKQMESDKEESKEDPSDKEDSSSVRKRK